MGRQNSWAAILPSALLSSAKFQYDKIGREIPYLYLLFYYRLEGKISLVKKMVLLIER